MNSKLVAGGVILALIMSGIAVFSGGERGQDGKDGRDGMTVGAVPVLSSPMEVDGVLIHTYTTTFRTATSTVCSYRTPNATTTDLVISARVASADFATSWEIGAGTHNNASSTSLVTFSDGEGIYGSAGTVFAPLTFINVRLATSSAGVGSNFDPVGECNFSLQEI